LHDKRVLLSNSRATNREAAFAELSGALEQILASFRANRRPRIPRAEKSGTPSTSEHFVQRNPGAESLDVGR
jgi:hypothetical protein